MIVTHVAGVFNIAARIVNQLAYMTENPGKPALGPQLMQWEICGADIFYMFLSCAIYLPLTMAVDYLKNFPAIRAKIPGLGDAQVRPSPSHPRVFRQHHACMFFAQRLSAANCLCAGGGGGQLPG